MEIYKLVQKYWEDIRTASDKEKDFWTERIAVKIIDYISKCSEDIIRLSLNDISLKVLETKENYFKEEYQKLKNCIIGNKYNRNKDSDLAPDLDKNTVPIKDDFQELIGYLIESLKKS